MADVSLTIEQAFELAREHHRAGRLDVAATIYQRILTTAPGHGKTLHYLGILASQTGQLEKATELLSKAAAAVPHDAAVHHDLGEMHRVSGRLEAAAAALQRALGIDPGSGDSHFGLAMALHGLGLTPGIDPAEKQRLLEEALVHYQKSIEVEPRCANSSENWDRLGMCQAALGKEDEAIACLERAVELNPKSADALHHLGVALHKVRGPRPAIDVLKRLHMAHPQHVDGLIEMAGVLREVGLIVESISCCRRAIELEPGGWSAHANLGLALNWAGRNEEAVAAYRRAVELAPQEVCPHDDLLLMMHYSPTADPESIFHEHRLWNQRHALPLAGKITPHANSRDPYRRLRVGYVSGDFRQHAVARNFLPLITNHDRSQFEIYCYSNVDRPDRMTRHYQTLVDHWRVITPLSDDQAAALIRQDQIDILIDLSGHTGANRLLVFARKPAPIQVIHQGYPDTSGMDVMDYRFTDAHADPPGQTERFHTEELVRLTDCAWAFQPYDETPEVRPRQADAPITFCSFNFFAKVTEPMMRLWAAILRQTPLSRLLIKSMGLTQAPLREGIVQLFASEGISADRLQVLPWVATTAEHLAFYHQVDIALDTFPYNGTAMTCESLWMGVPVVTLAGRTHASRVGVSLLTNVGVPELIARSPEEYVRIAVELAANQARLAELRRRLREKMRNSPLLDGPGYARKFEAALRGFWRKWCKAG